MIVRLGSHFWRSWED